MFFECDNLVVRRGRAAVLTIEHLAVEAGCITALVGPNGSGKTTLLEVMALLRRPAAGSVRLWGAPPADTPAQRRTAVMVMHPPYLFRGHVWENVLYGLRARGVSRKAAAARAAEALATVGLAGVEHCNVAELSAGQRQRVNLARAIATGPKALLLDEPTANVDSETVELIRELLRSLRQHGQTTIVYTSPTDSPLRNLSDHTIELSNGRVGNPIETTGK